jgi:hypothetical protein
MNAKQSPTPPTDFLSEVPLAFAYLLDSSGFHVGEAVAGASFDNARVVFRSSALLIAIQRERGHITADFASVTKPGQWGQLELVLDHLDGSSKNERYLSRGAGALDSLAALIKANLNRIAPLFSPESIAQTLARLNVLGEERAERLFSMRPS